MFKTYFDQLHVIELAASLTVLFISILLFNKKKTGPAMLLLLVSGFILRVFMITLDPFLNTWDEQLHALVAKNMMNHPFRPLFYNDPVLPYDYKCYIANTIWVHKPPLFLWQMALSMKIFGVNEVALRVPGLIMTTIMIWLVYRTGKLTMNQSIGYIAAMLFAFGNFALELVSGWWHTDHNDNAFMFYVAASIWAFTEYYYNPKWKWAILTGILAGCAVLVKWLPALIVFLIWFVTIVTDKEKRYSRRSYYVLVISFLTCLIVSMPWTIYTFLAFPKEAAWESRFNMLHILTPLDGHSGDIWYHFNKLDELYFPFAKILIFPALFFLYRYSKNKQTGVAFIIAILVVIVFFSVVKTKMPAFTTMINMLVYISFAALLYGVWYGFKLRNRIPGVLYVLILSAALFAIAVFNLNIEKIQYIHTRWQQEHRDHRRWKMADRKVYDEIAGKYKNGKYVVFNVTQHEHPCCMFYTSIPAYDFIPDESTFRDVLKKGRTPLIFRRDSLPPYILENKNTIIIRYNE